MVLLQDLIMGVFCNRDIYLSRLLESVDKYYPSIPRIIIKHKGTILDGYNNLMGQFEKSGKRFFLWMDDDIVILNPNIVEHALETLINGKYAVVMAYMSHNPESLKSPYDASILKSRLEKVAMGYFMLVDSSKVKGIKPDNNLPFPNISVETDYGLAIQASGYELGITNDFVYHQHKPDMNPQDGYLITNKYLEDKWGSFFRENVIYDGYLVDLPFQTRSI